MMDIINCKKAVLLVAAQGGNVNIVNSDGEVVATQGLMAGRHKASQFIEFMAQGDCLSFEDGVTPMLPSGQRVASMPYGEGATQTGANPDFKVTSADRYQRELDRKLAALNGKITQLAAERRVAQADAAVNRIPDEPVDLIDDDDQGDVVDPEIIVEGGGDEE